MFVPHLVGPLLTTEGVHLVKGFYRRPLKVSGSEDANGGGRVTELVARPLLAALRPELSCLLQPLGGEYAGTRELLRRCRSRPATAWRSGCWSTPMTGSAWMPSRR